MWRFALAVSIAVALAESATADIIQIESLDLAVARADLVVCGEVVEIVSKKGDKDVVWTCVTVRVTKVIKGEKLKKVSFVVREAPFEVPGVGWRNWQDEVLFCLDAANAPQGPFRMCYVLRGDDWLFWAIPLSGKPRTRLPIYGAEFRPLTDPKEILAAARSAASDKAIRANASLEWVVQDALLLDHAVLFPDSDRLRGTAKARHVELFPRSQ